VADISSCVVWVIFIVGEGEVQSTLFLHFQSLLLYFKSKQVQNFSHNKATLYTQYHAKT